jgi:hypothetical protein
MPAHLVKELLARSAPESSPHLALKRRHTLAGTVTKHVGVKQGGCQEAEAGDGEEDKGSADNHQCNRRLKLAWWEKRTQWHYRNWKQFKKAFVANWVAEAERRGNMAVDDHIANSAHPSQQAASGGDGKVVSVSNQPPLTHPPW